MSSITIPKDFIAKDDLVVIPRKQYEYFLEMKDQYEKVQSQEKDTDEAVSVYKKEKKQGKLKILKSLASLSV